MGRDSRRQQAGQTPFSEATTRGRNAEQNISSVRYDAKERILVVTLVGDFGKKDVLRIHEDASKRQKECEILGILVDARLARSRVSTVERLELLSSLRERFSPTTKHAVVYSPDSHDLSEVAFAENVASNRGVRLKMFTDINDARAWFGGIDQPS